MKKILINILLCLSPAHLMRVQFADMVFVVDQSGSMYNEFKWIGSSPDKINRKNDSRRRHNDTAF